MVALPTAPFWARRYTRRFLDRCRDITEETTRTAELVVSELVTNSVRFSGCPEQALPQPQPYPGRADAPLISLSLRYFRAGLLIEVYDTTSDPPALAHPSGDAENGRGLMLVGALTKEWAYFLLPDGGKVVYCFLDTVTTLMKSGCMFNVPDQDDALRIASFFGTHVGWSVFWDKSHGVWRVSEDDPSSDLYEESADAQRVIAYVAAHS